MVGGCAALALAALPGEEATRLMLGDGEEDAAASFLGLDEEAEAAKKAAGARMKEGKKKAAEKKAAEAGSGGAAAAPSAEVPKPVAASAPVAAPSKKAAEPKAEEPKTVSWKPIKLKDGKGGFKVEALCDVRFVPLLDGVARDQ